MTESDETKPTFLYEFERDLNVSKLIEFLSRSPKASIRGRAAEMLGGLPPLEEPAAEDQITEALIQTVREDDADSVRAMAIDALYIRDQNGLEQLVDVLSAGDQSHTQMSGGVSRQTILTWLQSTYPEFRMVATALLGRIGDESVIPLLFDRLTDPDGRVRARAVKSCGVIGNPQCVDVVANRLDDRNPIVRRAAAVTLGEIGTEDAVDALYVAIRAEDDALRKAAADALGAAGDPDSIEKLIGVLEDKSPVVRKTAARSLIELLATASPERSDAARREVADTLTRGDNPKAVAQLVSLLEADPDRSTRRNATWLLGMIADTEYDADVHEPLVAALGDSDDVTAQIAMSTLTTLEGPGLKKRIRRYKKNDVESATANARATAVLEKLTTTPPREVVANKIKYTYVSDPADYTTTKPNEDRDTEPSNHSRNN